VKRRIVEARGWWGRRERGLGEAWTVGLNKVNQPTNRMMMMRAELESKLN
jgi:hypothetical protein